MGFVSTELAWPSTWTDRSDHDRTPSIPGHELAGVVTALGYGTTGLSIGQRVFGLADWHRDGTLAEYVAMEARDLAPLPGDFDFSGRELADLGPHRVAGTVRSRPPSAGQSVIAHGAAGAVGSMVAQLAERPAPTSSARAARPTARQRLTSARTSSSTLATTGWKMSAASTGVRCHRRRNRSGPHA